MRICNECGHVFESSTFKCEKCDSLNIERINPNDQLKEDDWLKLLSPSKETKIKIAVAILVILVILIASLFDDPLISKLVAPLLALIFRH